jgi:exodeoxyribonuclease-3
VSWGLILSYGVQLPVVLRYSWWYYRAGGFLKTLGMRIDHLLVSPPLARRVIASEIDREARKGKPTPSDHTPLILDLDEPGRAFDAGWAGVEERSASRRK